MAKLHSPSPARPLHPLHAIILAFPLPLFLAALVSDVAYSRTYQVQWANFSAWLIAGAMVGGGLVLLCALVGMVRYQGSGSRRPLLYFLVLLAMWVIGFINALVHAKDAWATMPQGLYLSVVTTLLALVAAWIGYSGFYTVEVR